MSEQPKKMQPIVAREIDGDWYLIPSEIHSEFSKLLAKLDSTEEYTEKWYKLTEEFDAKYGKYRLLGDINKIQLYAEI